MIQVLQPPRTILEVWKSLPEGTLCQLINNNLIMSPAPKTIHQSVLNKINFSLYKIVEADNLGEVFISPFDVHFSKRNILQPDLVFVAAENLHLLEEKGLVGSPDIIVEILSPSTSHIDLGEKRDIYEHYGVKEYFIVDPNNKKVSSLILDGKEFKEIEETTGKFYSALLGTTISF
jgi:Uma2 family endonuclease